MNIVYCLQGVDFEWDARKAQINVEKHRVTFEEAAEAFFDPFYQTGEATVNGEQREFILGYSLAYRILFIVYVERNQRTRIISARPATCLEKKQYEQA